MSLQETSVKVKSGKYTFIIKEKTIVREEDIMYTTLQIGGEYPDCVSIFIQYVNNKPSSANMSHAMYDEECVTNENNTNRILLSKGDGSKVMIQTLISYLRQKYPTITEIKYDDMSSIECATDEELMNAKNRKRGSNLKPMSLYNLSIAYNGLTWYEKYFGGRQQNVETHAKYRERVKILLHDKATKPENFNEFIKIARVPPNLWTELFEFYKSTETYGEFFNLIPKTERCRLLRPWIDTFMAHYLKNVFHNSNWIMPVLVMGGKKTRKTRRKTPAFYVPNGVRLNVGYQINSGVSMDNI